MSERKRPLLSVKRLAVALSIGGLTAVSFTLIDNLIRVDNVNFNSPIISINRTIIQQTTGKDNASIPAETPKSETYTYSQDYSDRRVNAAESSTNNRLNISGSAANIFKSASFVVSQHKTAEQENITISSRNTAEVIAKKSEQDSPAPEQTKRAFSFSAYESKKPAPGTAHKKITLQVQARTPKPASQDNSKINFTFYGHNERQKNNPAK